MSVGLMGVELKLNIPRSEAMKSELGKYNEVGKLLIGINTTELLGPEDICNFGGYPHEEDRDGAKNITQGCIQSVAELGMIEGMI